MEKYSNEFCQMELHDHYAILTINENEDLTLKKANVIREKLREYYKTKDFLMISHRKFKHTVSTEIYKKGQLDTMKGLAIVSSNNEERDKAIIEQQLYGKSFVFFKTLEEAKSWAQGYF